MPFSHHWLQRLRGSVVSVSASRFRGRQFESRRRQFLFYFYREVYRIFSGFLFIFSLSFLYVFFVSSQENACISEFDLLLSTYSKWLYNDQFRSYLVNMYIAHFHITHFPNLIILVVTKFMLHVFQQISNHASWEDLTVIFHVKPMCIYPLA